METAAQSDGRIPATVQVLARNNAASLVRCLESLRGFSEVLVQDGGSTDGSQDVARGFPNVTVRPQPASALDGSGRITDFSAVRNDGIAAAKHDWILVVDADEEIGADLTQEVRAIVARDKPAVYRAFRRFVVDGRKIAHSAFYPAYQIRLFHRSCTNGYVKPVHERLDLKAGQADLFLTTEVLVPLPQPQTLVSKYERYVHMEARRTLGMGYGRWLRWVLARNILSAAALLTRSLMLRWRHPRSCLPLAYEWLHVRHLFRTIVATFPPVAGRYAKNAPISPQTSSI